MTNKTAQNEEHTLLPSSHYIFLKLQWQTCWTLRSTRLRCETHFLSSNDRKYKLKMNWTALEQKFFSIITIEGLFGTKIIVKYL